MSAACFQEVRFDDYSPPTRIPFARHFWTIESESLSGSASEPAVVLTRRWRCLRCPATLEVSGEPSPDHFGR